MKKIFLVKLFIWVVVCFTSAQKTTIPFSVRLEKVEIKDLPMLQSYSFAIWGNKWILIGGRIDGLHRRQPFAAFNEAGMNNFIYVVDIKKGKVLKQDLSSLSVTIAEQLQSTNMQFYQDGQWLILTGGYGFSPSTKKFFTHPHISFINIPELIRSIEKRKPIATSIIQLKDEKFAVTGGRLFKIDSVYYLAGGQKFNGRYNPHGPDHGPGFFQEYTNAIRRFSFSIKDRKPKINHLSEWYDSLQLHRRDYNLLPQRDENDKLYLTMFSGVFQYGKDLPFKTMVDIRPNGYQLQDGFEQQFSHYHTASLPIFSRVDKSMYNIFFGGIAQRYLSSATDTITDNDVPFVKTISVIVRRKNVIFEKVLPVTMPGYLGASAEFIPANQKLFSNGILLIEGKSSKPIHAGFIYGGINSSDKNIFWKNSGKESSASSVLWKIIIE
jgi:hypothetical protein